MNKKITLIIIVIILLTLGNFILAKYMSVNLFCALFSIQNILLPAISASYLISKFEPENGLRNMALGAFFGAVTGLIPTTSMILASAIRYYLLGEKQLLEEATGQTLPATTEVFLAGIIAYIFVWIVLIIISSLSGLTSVYRSTKNRSSLPKY